MKKILLFISIVLLPITLFSQTVFINEIHYDNTGTDANEGIEIAGPAGTDLTGWSLVAYNGNGGAVYSTVALSGTIPDQMNGYGTLWFPIVGLQNGSPDGVALVDGSSVVIQFLSYEGSFTAVDGAASGLTSTDIGVIQGPATDAFTMQLQGLGLIYTDFTWATDIAETRGSVNTGQTFGVDTDPPTWSDGYPLLTNILDTRGDLLVSLNEPGKVYYIVVPAGSTAPTSEEVKTGISYGAVTVYVSGSVDVAEAGTEYLEVIGGATAGESYDIYVVAEDVASTPNLQAAPVRLEVTMTGARSIMIISPQSNETYYVGSQVVFRWNSENITNIMIGGYDVTWDEYFFLTDEEGEPYIIDASLGEFWYTIPNSVSTDEVDITFFDAADLSFFVTSTSITIVDEIDPALSLTFPEPDATGVTLDAVLIAHFDEEIYAGTGNVVIKKADGTVVETFDISTAASGGSIELTDQEIIIRPSQQFDQATEYYVEMDAGVVVDYKDNPFAGITGMGTWSFTTLSVPTPIYFDDFDDGDLLPWTVYSASGDTKEWIARDEAAYMSGHNSGEIEEDWLISPVLDVTYFTDLFVMFDVKYTYETASTDDYLKLYYSTDYDGNTDNLGTATWTEIPFDIPLSSDTYLTNGPISIPDTDQPLYFAFKYYYPNPYANWWVDNCLVAGVAVPGSVATLSDLMVDGVTIDGFNPATTNYTVVLPAGTTTPPEVTFETTDIAASGEVADATDLSGDDAARTTTVTVTSDNGLVSKIYSIRFDPIIEVSDLAALRAVTDYNRIYSVSGEVVVTAIVSYQNQKWIEDASAGIQIFDADGNITTVFSEGDGITGVTGTLLDYNGMLEFIPYSDPGAASSTGNTITPQVLTIAEFKSNFENYESELVRIEDVTFSDADGSSTFANGTDYVITNNSDETILRVHFYGTTLTGSVIPGTADVIGIALWHSSAAKISPRYLEDLVISTGSDETLAERLRIYPIPVKFELTIENMTGVSSVDVIDMTGSRIMSRNIEGLQEYRLDVSELPRGIYFIRLKAGDQVLTRKFVKE